MLRHKKRIPLALKVFDYTKSEISKISNIFTFYFLCVTCKRVNRKVYQTKLLIIKTDCINYYKALINNTLYIVKNKKSVNKRLNHIYKSYLRIVNALYVNFN